MEKEEKGGLIGTGGLAEAGTDWLRVLTEVFMMSATIFWRDRPWGSAGGLAGVVLSGILQQFTFNSDLNISLTLNMLCVNFELWNA